MYLIFVELIAAKWRDARFDAAWPDTDQYQPDEDTPPEKQQERQLMSASDHVK